MKYLLKKSFPPLKLNNCLFFGQVIRYTVRRLSEMFSERTYLLKKAPISFYFFTEYLLSCG